MKGTTQTIAAALIAALCAGSAAAQGLGSAFGAARTILKGGTQGVPAGIAAPRLQGGQLAAAAAKRRAPDFSLKDLDGNAVSLSQFRGKHVIVELWATWCGGCRAATPKLAGLQEKYGGKGLVILAVSDQSKDEITAYFDEAEKKLGKRPSYKVLQDPKNVVAKQYRARYIPYFIYVAPDGSVEVNGSGVPVLEKAVEKFKEAAGIQE